MAFTSTRTWRLKYSKIPLLRPPLILPQSSLTNRAVLIFNTHRKILKQNWYWQQLVLTAECSCFRMILIAEVIVYSVQGGHHEKSLCNFDPFKHLSKMGFAGVYIIFLISAQKHRLWVLFRTASPRRF